VLDFDASTNEDAVFSAIMPRLYAGTTGITVYIHYAMSSATSGDVDWDVSFERIGDQQLDIDADSFAAVNSVDNTTVPGTSAWIGGIREALGTLSLGLGNGPQSLSFAGAAANAGGAGGLTTNLNVGGLTFNTTISNQMDEDEFHFRVIETIRGLV
jgi:hypothetical protein